MKYLERGTDLGSKKKLLFDSVFIQENKLHSVVDYYSDVRVKQLLLLDVCQSYDKTPCLSDLARDMGCTRQNVKVLASALEKEELLYLEKPKPNSRFLYVHITKKGTKALKKYEQFGEKMHNELFKNFTNDEIEQYYNLSKKMNTGIDSLEQFFESSEEKESE